MSTEFLMPKLGLTMEEGTILEWLVPNGAQVTQGSAVLIVATDKVETEVECIASGTLQQIAEVGATIECGLVIAHILGADEGVVAVADPTAPAPSVAGGAASGGSSIATNAAPVASTEAAPVAVRGNGDRLLASPNARRVAADLGVSLGLIVGSGPGGRIVSEDVEAAASKRVTNGAGSGTAARVPASGAAAKFAELVGLDLAEMAAGADGSISRQDVADHVRGRLAAPIGGLAGVPAVAALPSVTTIAQEPTKVVPMRGMRGTIATRMMASLTQMAQLTLSRDADMDAVWADREARKASGIAPSYTDYVIAAVAQALRVHPMVNSQVCAEGIAVLPDIHVGLAVALDGGLVVPVIRSTDRLRLDAIASETVRLSTASRAGKLALADMEGGTFSVSTLGAFGVDVFTPVINPPNVAILGVGRVRDEVVWRGDAIGRARRMTLSLTWDHRVLDGVPAAEFCRTICELLEDPSRLG
jgi:pyruvate dehydrogenase E2 component (dihydrolipoamide acetyltransferase)